MQRLTILERLALVVVPPLVILAVMFAVLVGDKRQEVVLATRVVEYAETSRVVAALVHELQRERGASVGVVASKRQKAEAVALLDEQRARSDGAVAAYLAMRRAPSSERPARFEAMLVEADRRLRALADERRAIDGLNRTVPQVLSWYSAGIRDLMTTSAEVVKTVEDGAVTLSLFMSNALMEAKENAGLERATGNALISGGTVDPGRYRSFVESAAREADRLAEFAAMARGLRDPLVRRVEEAPMRSTLDAMRKVLSDSLDTGTFAGLSAADWWKTTTAWIDTLKAIEDDLGAGIARDGAGAKATAESRFALYAAGGSTVLVLAALFGLSAVRSIVRPMHRAAAVIDAINAGDTSVEAPAALPARSEIGRVSNALRAFIDVLDRQRAFERERLEQEARLASSRRTILMTMAEEVERSTETGMGEIVRGSGAVQSQAAEMLEALRSVRTAAGEAADAASQTRDLNAQASEMTHEVFKAIGEIADQVARSSSLTRDAVDRARQ